MAIEYIEPEKESQVRYLNVIESRWSRISSLLRNIFDADYCGVMEWSGGEPFVRAWASRMSSVEFLLSGNKLSEDFDYYRDLVSSQSVRVLLYERDGTETIGTAFYKVPVFGADGEFYGALFMINSKSELFDQMRHAFHDLAKIMEDDLAYYARIS